jgi:hypothetical protein
MPSQNRRHSTIADPVMGALPHTFERLCTISRQTFGVCRPYLTVKNLCRRLSLMSHTGHLGPIRHILPHAWFAIDFGKVDGVTSGLSEWTK